MAAPRKRKAKVELTPWKVTGQLVAAVRNSKGEVIGEQLVGNVDIYVADFPRFAELVEARWTDSAEQLDELAATLAEQVR